jgi:thiol:disulfide interchange protein DsbD
MSLSGNHIDYITAFLGGVGVSFTPCVYPLIPVTIGYIGATASGSKLKGLGLSLIYVTGVAVTYSILGLLAVLTGKLFGSISSSPLTYFFVGTVIILFGLSMLDLFMVPLPNIVKLPVLKKENYFSIFLLGLSSGLVVSPCLTPVLGSILVYLTTQKNLLYGATLLFSFAYGMGFVLVIAGTFSAALVNLPRLGKWMLYIKKIFSFIIIGMGIYFIYSGIRRM